MLERLSLRLRVFLFFAALAGGSLAALIFGLTLGYRRLGTPETLSAFVQGGLVAGFVILGLVAWVWYLFDTHVAKAIEALAGNIRARAHSDLAGEIDATPARYLGDLAPAASAVALNLSETRNALAEAVARETTRLSAEKQRLEALLSDVPVGVLLCSGHHQLVFYNGQAMDFLGAAGTPGLDRNLFDYLRDAPLRHAHQRLIEARDPDAASDLLCTTTGRARILSGRMRLLGDGGDGAVPGYVLTLRDVTADLAAHTRRETLLDEVFERIRRPAANLQTVMGVLEDDPTLIGKADIGKALLEEVGTLARAVTELAGRHDEGRSEGWPLAMVRASDLADGLRARIEADGGTLEVRIADLMLRCDGFEVISLLDSLAERLAGAGLGHGFRLAILEEGSGALIRLEWPGEALPIGQLEGWLDDPLEVGMADVTARRILQSHATELWPEAVDGTNGLCLPIRQSRRAVHRPAPIARAVVYDFDLLSKARNDKVADTLLSDLTYVVFDTETTGLLPGQGDEIVQIAAVRLVNGRRVEAEVFDTLVNPGRPIPAASTAVHGITDEMVAEAPGIAEIGARFHRFAAGSVLIAHNAPFDMEFLRRHEEAIGARFDNPVLDTVLLSAVVFGQHESHSLDALTHRLGITIPEEARHTAIGDTIATADAFLKLLPVLQGRGLNRFGDVLTEVRRHSRLLKDLN